MPSVFEPGGIVQHEFFIAGTPVIAFKTGGLKDTVIEFEWITSKGNGIVFEVLLFLKIRTIHMVIYFLQ
jgi:starch synthase